MDDITPTEFIDSRRREVVQGTPTTEGKLGTMLGHKGLSCHLRGWHPTWVPVKIQTASLPIQLSANVSEKAVNDGLGATCKAELQEVPSFWLQLGPALAIIAIQDVN